MKQCSVRIYRVDGMGREEKMCPKNEKMLVCAREATVRFEFRIEQRLMLNMLYVSCRSMSRQDMGGSSRHGWYRTCHG